jgi:hypothetical protein
VPQNERECHEFFTAFFSSLQQALVEKVNGFSFSHFLVGIKIGTARSSPNKELMLVFINSIETNSLA